MHSNAQAAPDFWRQWKLHLIVACGILVAIIGLSLVAFQHWQQAVQLQHRQLERQAFNRQALRGFDVSHHQGKIDWQKIPATYHFVYLKATEGGDYHDPNFNSNWQGARQRGLKVGAYHYYRYCTAVAAQIANVIATVPNVEDSLPPVIDIEFQYDCPTLSAEQLQRDLHAMAQQLQLHYGKPAIFYTTPHFYAAYLQRDFKHDAIWLQDFKQPPDPYDVRPWLFWQYSRQGKIEGIAGDVDLNLFRATPQQLDALTRVQTATSTSLSHH